MTKLEQAFQQASRLPPQEQEALADFILQEIASERRWEDLFAGSAALLDDLAEEALKEHRAGRTRILDPETL